MIVLLPYIDERNFSFLDEVRRQGSGRRAASIKRFIERLENNNSSDSDKPRKRKRKSSTKKKVRKKQKKFSGGPIGTWIRTGSLTPTDYERENPSTAGMVKRGSLVTGIAGATLGAITGDATDAIAGGLLGAGVGAGLGLTAGALANRNN
jgi:hypothetical protein